MHGCMKASIRWTCCNKPTNEPPYWLASKTRLLKYRPKEQRDHASCSLGLECTTEMMTGNYLAKWKSWCNFTCTWLRTCAYSHIASLASMMEGEWGLWACHYLKKCFQTVRWIWKLQPIFMCLKTTSNLFIILPVESAVDSIPGLGLDYFPWLGLNLSHVGQRLGLRLGLNLGDSTTTLQITLSKARKAECLNAQCVTTYPDGFLQLFQVMQIQPASWWWCDPAFLARAKSCLWYFCKPVVSFFPSSSVDMA